MSRSNEPIRNDMIWHDINRDLEIELKAFKICIAILTQKNAHGHYHKTDVLS